MKKILFLLISLPLWWACNSGDAHDSVADRAVPVKNITTLAAERVLYNPSVVAAGQLSAREEAQLSFKTGGIIRRIPVREGQAVKAGQLLAELELDEIRAQAQQARLGQKQAEVQLQNAQLALRKAERDFANIQGLYADSVATHEQLKDARTLLDNARNQVDAARAGLDFAGHNVEVAEYNLKYSRIVAPASGTVLKKMAEVNELAASGQPVLLFGSQDKAMVIRVNVTDKDVIHLKLGAAARVAFDAFPEQFFKGTVREIASKADPYTNTFEVEVEVLPEGKPLFSGFIGRVEIETRRTEALVRIPVNALISADGRDGLVFVEKSGRVQERRIRIFRLESDQLLIESGLEPGERVVASGGSYLEENDSVLIGIK